MPEHFRWLWYLVGLAGMTLTVVGALARIGSIIAEGLLLPVIVGTVLAIAAAIALQRRKRRLHEPQGPDAKTRS